jgi:hypothetical protein
MAPSLQALTRLTALFSARCAQVGALISPEGPPSTCFTYLGLTWDLALATYGLSSAWAALARRYLHHRRTHRITLRQLAAVSGWGAWSSYALQRPLGAMVQHTMNWQLSLLRSGLGWDSHITRDIPPPVLTEWTALASFWRLNPPSSLLVPHSPSSSGFSSDASPTGVGATIWGPAGLDRLAHRWPGDMTATAQIHREAQGALWAGQAYTVAYPDLPAMSLVGDCVPLLQAVKKGYSSSHTLQPVLLRIRHTLDPAYTSQYVCSTHMWDDSLSRLPVDSPLPPPHHCDWTSLCSDCSTISTALQGLSRRVPACLLCQGPTGVAPDRPVTGA